MRTLAFTIYACSIYHLQTMARIHIKMGVQKFDFRKTKWALQLSLIPFPMLNKFFQQFFGTASWWEKLIQLGWVRKGRNHLQFELLVVVTKEPGKYFWLCFQQHPWFKACPLMIWTIYKSGIGQGKVCSSPIWLFVAASWSFLYVFSLLLSAKHHMHKSSCLKNLAIYSFLVSTYIWP